jgi:hypothetical protein
MQLSAELASQPARLIIRAFLLSGLCSYRKPPKHFSRFSHPNAPGFKCVRLSRHLPEAGIGSSLGRL